MKNCNSYAKILQGMFKSCKNVSNLSRFWSRKKQSYSSFWLVWGVVIDYHAILEKEGRTIREGVLIKGADVTEGVRYVISK